MPNELTSCMHVTYIRHAFDKSQDALVVKERVKDTKTGEETPRLKIIPNYQRPVHIVKKALQTYTQKKDYEYLANCDEYRSNQANLANIIKRALGVHGDYVKLKELCRSPFVYGADVTPSVLYKKDADDAAEEVNGDWRPNMTVAAADYETDVVNGHEQIISGAITYNQTCFIVVTAAFLGIKGITKDNIVTKTKEQDEKLQCAINKHLRRHVNEIDLKVKIKIVPNAYACAKAIMMAAHKLKPDLLTFWNMQFDINKMLDACKEFNKDPADLFCDPSIPTEYRTFYWKEDKLTKLKADGTYMRKHPADLWNVVTAAASFYIIDAMVVFKMLRVVEGMRQSFSLDAILKDEEIGGKLRIDETDKYTGLDWHRHMQRDYKIEYLVYNAYDVVSMLQLEKKTKDLTEKIQMYADGTELSMINSNPRRLCNGLHFYLKEQGKVPCASSDDMKEADDEHLLGRNDWVVTLHNELANGTGTELFDKDWGDFISRISSHVADIDISSGYPTAQFVMNISKSTTLVEVCSIFGHDEETQRRIGVNLTYIPSNSVDIAETILGMPEMQWWVDEFSRDMAA